MLTKANNAEAIVEEEVGAGEDELPDLESRVTFPRWGRRFGYRGYRVKYLTPTPAHTKSFGSVNDVTPTDDFKPIAPDGEVKFFGRVSPGDATGY